MKKIIYYLLGLLLVIVIGTVIFELILQAVPVIYRNLPNDNNKIYVYVLGESISMGHPYNEKISFSKIIQYMTGNKINNKGIEIIMLARDSQRISQQYLRYFLYKYMHPFKKGIVLCYMKGTGDWANKNNNYDFSLNLKYNVVGFLSTYFTNIYDFRYEYERIIKLAKSFGDDMYVSTIAGNYAGCMPNNVSSLINNKELKENIKEIDNLIVNKKYDVAIEKCNKILNENEDKSQIWYRIGKIYEGQNKVKEANEAYLNAVEYGDDHRPTRYENEVIKELVRKYNVNLVDVVDNLNEIIGYNYFIDIVHPTVRLHTIIAEEFIKSLSKKYDIKIINNDITEETILKSLDFTEKDLFTAYRDALGEIFFYSFYNNIFDIYNINKMEAYILKMKALHQTLNSLIKNDKEKEDREYIISISELILTYIQGDKVKVIEILNDKKLINRIKFGKVNMQCWWVFKSWIIDFISKNNL